MWEVVVRKFLVLSSALLAMIAAPAVAAPNQIVNGDFETGSGTNIPGWIVADSPNSALPFDPAAILLVQGSDYQSCCNVVGAGSSAAALDNHFLSFGAGNVGNSASIIQQPFLNAGTYTFEFDFGAIQGTQTMAFQLFNLTTNTTLLVDFLTSTGGQNLDSLFNHYSYTFTTAPGLVQVQFTNFASSTDNTDAFVDNVSLQAVPEPATWAMMIGGFALVGASMRRRVSQANVRFA